MNDGGKGSDRRPGEGYQLGWDRVFSRGVKTQSIPQAITQIPQAHSSTAQELQQQAEELAKLGWQSIECPSCGSAGARAFPKPAQPQQEPVQKMVANMTVEEGRISFAAKILTDGTYDLYTSPPQRKPLTDEQLLKVIKTIDRDEQFIQQALRHLARAIEAAHGIKGAA